MQQGLVTSLVGHERCQQGRETVREMLPAAQGSTDFQDPPTMVRDKNEKVLEQIYQSARDQ
jgi:hypothetical protein